MADKKEEILEEEKDTETAEDVTEETTEAAEEKSTEETTEEEAAGEEAQETAEEEVSGETAEEAAGEKDGAKKGFFKKKKDKKDEQIEELTDQVKRQMAEFDNFRKRTEKEKTQMYDMGARSIVEKILPVIDNFERGLAGVPEEQKEDAFVVGMDKIYRQMLTELETIGVTPIEALGKEFDPEYHNAVMQVESEEFESGVVAQELQKGYMYKDSVVRHSMVAVVS
ncbi:MAG: nucleotide exchange factor GrpE [Roseburia sp.]|nr:nucleotide exchange factor GrpE [Roseburia sp.]